MTNHTQASSASFLCTAQARSLAAARSFTILRLVRPGRAVPLDRLAYCIRAHRDLSTLVTATASRESCSPAQTVEDAIVLLGITRIRAILTALLLRRRPRRTSPNRIATSDALPFRRSSQGKLL